MHDGLRAHDLARCEKSVQGEFSACLRYNLRWLLRAIARLGIGAAFLRLWQAALLQQWVMAALYGTTGSAWTARVRDCLDRTTIIKKPIFDLSVYAA